MKLRSFMLLDLARCLYEYLFSLWKVYAGNACLVIGASTFLKLSTVRIPTYRAAWLKLAFASPVRRHSVNLYFWNSILMSWTSKALSNLSLFRWSSSKAGKIDLIGSRIIITRGVITFDRYAFSFFSTFSSDLSRFMIRFSTKVCIFTFF